jgi:hypothetical protein
MTSSDTKRNRLFGALRKIAEETRHFDPPYIPGRFLQDLAISDPTELVARDVLKPNPSEGFERFWREGRLDLSVENVAWRFRWLFPQEVSRAARERLRAAGFDPAAQHGRQLKTPDAETGPR